VTPNATELQALLDAQPKPDCAALTPTVEIKSSFVAPMKLGECPDGKLAVHATATAAGSAG
jgi:hypothetical protein